MPNWKKVVTSGSDASLNKLTVTNGITGSLFGTASFAVSSSFSTTASYVLNATSASYAATASYAKNSSDILVYVKNSSGAQINKGKVVKIAGAVGDNALITTASYFSDNESANTLGITNETIANDSFGYVITEGTLIGINTDAFTAGQLIYLGDTGSIIGTAPVAPLHAVRLGQVLRSQLNNGSIYVRIDNGFELGELHDVKDTTTSGSYGDLLIKSGSIWINSRQLTGSYGLTGSLQATSFTGSLFGTASFASTASFVANAQTASYVLNAVSASFATSASQAQNASTASYVLNAVSASFALGGNGNFSGSFTGSFYNLLNINSILGSTFNSFTDRGTNAYRSLSGLAATTADYVLYRATGTAGSETFFEAIRVENATGNVRITSSLIVTGSLISPVFVGTGSLQGTASFALKSNTQSTNNNSDNIATTNYVDSKRPKSYCFSAGYNATLATSVEEVAFCIMISASFVAVNDILELYQFHSVNSSANAKTVSTYLSPQVETVGSTISANAKKIATITGLTGAGAQSSGLARHFAIRSNTTMINTYNPSLSLGTDTGTIAAVTVVTNIPDITGSMYFVGVVNRSNSGDTVTINSSQLKLFKSE